MDAMTTDAAERLARRYPRPRTPRWLWVVVAVTAAAIGAVWLVWVAVVGANPPVSARIASFQVTSDTDMQVVVTIERPEVSVGAECLLYAQAVSYDRVGEVVVRVAPGGTHLTDVPVHLRTFKRATTAGVEKCRAIG